MEITPDQKDEYRNVLLPALRAAASYDGTEAAANRVLNEAIKAEQWLEAQFPGQKSSAVEAEIVKRDDGKSTPTFQEILGRSLSHLAKVLPQSNDPREIAASLGIPCTEVKGVLLPPDSLSREIQTGNGEGLEPVEYQPRFASLLLALKDIGIYTDDLIVTVGTLNADQMRSVSYALIEIPRMKAEILVCDQVGQATFVSNRTLGLSAYQEMTKSELGMVPGVKRVVHTDHATWVREILEHLQSKEMGEKLDVRDLSILRSAIQGRFSARQFVELGYWERKIKIEGLGLMAIARKFNVVCEPCMNSSVQLELAAAIWGQKHKDIEAALIKARADAQQRLELSADPEKWRAALEKAGIPAQRFVGLSTKEKRNFEFAGLGLIAIAGKFNVADDPIGRSTVQVELAAAIWGEKHKDIEVPLAKARANAQKLTELAADPKRWRAAFEGAGFTAKRIIELSAMERANLEIAGLGVKAIVGRFNLGGKWVNNSSVLKLATAIWGEEHNDIQAPLAKARADAQKLTELAADPDKWRTALEEAAITARRLLELSQRAGENFEFAGLGLQAIARKLNVAGNPARNSSVRLKLVVAIWGEEILRSEATT